MKNLKKAILLIVILFSLHMSGTSAAELYFGVLEKEVGVGEIFEVGVFANTMGETINTFSGSVALPENTVELVEIRDGNSLISLWIDKPHPSRASGVTNLDFSGIVPGGYRGERGMLFSFVIQSKQPGNVEIDIENGRLLRNDGEGSQARLTVAPITVVVVNREPAVNVLPIHDEISPEPFIVEVTRDDNLLDGKFVLIFQAVDKLSGIDHYLIKETGTGIFRTDTGWQKGESPFVLSDQTLRSNISVTAVDKRGNERTVSLGPQNPAPWYNKRLTVGLAALLLLLMWWYNRSALSRWRAIKT